MSEELAAALARAEDAADHATDADLKAEYHHAVAHIQRQIDEELREYEDEEDSGQSEPGKHVVRRTSHRTGSERLVEDE